MNRIRTKPPSSSRQLRASVVLLALVLVVGTLGFYLLGDSRGALEAVYLTVMIVTTVGLKDQYPRFNDAESAWSLVVMLVGVVTALYATGNLVAFLIGGELKSVLGRRQLEGKIKRLRNHFIICGFGRMGRALCDALRQRKTSFVVIDNNPQRTAMAEEGGYPTFWGMPRWSRRSRRPTSSTPGVWQPASRAMPTMSWSRSVHEGCTKASSSRPGPRWRRRNASCCGPARIESSAPPCKAPPG